MRLSKIVSATVLAGIAASSQATVCLWDQSDLNTGPTGVGFVNSVSPGFNGVVGYGMSDVTVPAGGWTINSVATYFSALSWFDPSSVPTAVLNIFPKTGALPAAGDDPRGTASGVIVPVTLTQIVVDFQGVNVVEAAGLNISLAAGDYWVGLTPIGPAGPFGPDYQWTTNTLVGQGQAVRFFSPDSGWLDESSVYQVPTADGAIKICGIPTPSALAVLGLGGLAIGRRRR